MKHMIAMALAAAMAAGLAAPAAAGKPEGPGTDAAVQEHGKGKGAAGLKRGDRPSPARALSRMDRDGDGRVSLEEFLAGSEAMARRAFERLSGGEDYIDLDRVPRRGSGRN